MNEIHPSAIKFFVATLLVGAIILIESGAKSALLFLATIWAFVLFVSAALN